MMYDLFELEVNEVSFEDEDEFFYFCVCFVFYFYCFICNLFFNIDIRMFDFFFSDDGLGSGVFCGNNEWNDEVFVFFDVEGFLMFIMV